MREHYKDAAINQSIFRKYEIKFDMFRILMLGKF